MKEKEEINIIVDKKIKLVKNILDSVYKLMNLFAPLLTKILKEEGKELRESGIVEEASTIFGEIATTCKKIDSFSIPSADFLKDPKN